MSFAAGGGKGTGTKTWGRIQKLEELVEIVRQGSLIQLYTPSA